LNGSCSNVCPVKINIHEQIYAWRRVLVERHETPLAKRAAMKAAGELLSRPAAYRAAIAAADMALAHLPRWVVYNGLNAWGRHREVPHPPKQTFHSWYQANRGEKRWAAATRSCETGPTKWGLSRCEAAIRLLPLCRSSRCVCSVVKPKVGYDDAFDAFGVHCIGGIIGAIGTGILVAPFLGGVGLVDYVVNPGTATAAEYVMKDQVLIQLKTVVFTLLWSGIGSAILYKFVDLTIGLRATKQAELEGLDVSDHGERAYNL